MKRIVRLLAYTLGFLSGGMSLLLFHKNKAPRGSMLWFPKLVAGALAPFFAIAGAVGALLGMLGNAPLAVLGGLLGSSVMARYVRRVRRTRGDFTAAFGEDWEEKIPPERVERMLPDRWAWKIPASPEPCWQRDLPFWIVPETGQTLLCDLWQPPAGVERSGLGLIYLHGSAWVMMDKDLGTRSFFRHLARQGHVIMDVAYRLAPETDMYGMIEDVKYAISWMKAHAIDFGVDAGRIVVGGGSAGGHLALLAAYAPEHPDLTPDDLIEDDLSVRGVIAEYGPADLVACYYHTNQDKMLNRQPARPAVRDSSSIGTASLMKWLLGKNYERLGMNKRMDAGSFVKLFGGPPEAYPRLYKLFSPISHVHPGCPPTLLIQGEDDMITPLGATQDLYHKLLRVGTPAVLVVYPQTEHGFDLAFPEVSPTAQSAMYEVERFLRLMAG